MPVTSTTLRRRWSSGPGSPRAVARTGAFLLLLIAFAVFLFPLAAVALPLDGNITGRVTNPGGVGIADVYVTAYEYSDGDWNWYQEAYTDGLGDYDIAGLPAGTYYLEFYDYTDTYLSEYYDNVDTLDAATGVPVTAGSTTANINAQLVVGGHITGKVTKPGGGALADAYITAYALVDGDWESVRDTYSDTLGNYDLGGLSAGTYRLEFSDDSDVHLSEYYNNAATLDAATGVPVTAGSTTANIDAQLALGGHITGKVTKPGGAGVAGARVAVYALFDGDWDYQRYTLADSLGNYEIAGLRTGTYYLEFSDESGVCAPEYYDNAATLDSATGVGVTAGSTTSGINASLALAGHITGKVTNPGGTGIADVEVTAYSIQNGAWDWFQSSTTDSLGNYNVGGLLTGTYRLEFYDNNETYLGEYYSNATTLDAATGVPVTAGATTANINASLALPGHITGKVTRPDGTTGIEDVDVTAYSLQGGVWDYYQDAYTNAAGTYNIGGLPTGTYRLEFWDGSGSYLGEYYNNVATLDGATGVPVTAGSTTANINASLALAGHITGKVTNPGGTGISDIDVNVYSLQGGVWDYYEYASTDSLGNYNVGGLPTGTYRVEFTDYDGAYAVEYYNNAATLDAATGVAVTAGSTTANINAQLASAGRITGKITTAGGTAIRGINVSAYVLSGGVWRQYPGYYSTDSLGDYDVGGLPTGTYRLRFTDDGGTYAGEYYNDVVTLNAATGVPVTAGSTTADINASLALAGHIAGKVTSPSGTPIEGITVTVYEASGGGTTDSWIDIQTDALGNYDASGLPTGNYRVRFEDNDWGLYRGEFYNDATSFASSNDVAVVEGATTPNINASLAYLANGTLTGTVKEGTVGLGGVTVSVPGTGSVTTAANGTYTLAGITPGTYTATYSKAGYVTQTPSVTITAGGTKTQNVTLVQAPGTLAGTVTSSTVGLSGVTVSVPGTGSVTTAANGTYTLAGIKPGTYTATYSKPSYITVTKSVTIKSGETLTQDVDMVWTSSVPVTVWRFRYTSMVGNYLWTSDPKERDTIKATLAGTWAYEGPAFTFNSANPVNADTMWRFKNKKIWSYFYTADPAERAAIQADPNSIWQYEGPTTIKISRKVATPNPVWRFQCLKNPTYLWTADPNEKNSIDANLKADYKLEGVAYYLGK